LLHYRVSSWLYPPALFWAGLDIDKAPGLTHKHYIRLERPVRSKEQKSFINNLGQFVKSLFRQLSLDVMLFGQNSRRHYLNIHVLPKRFIYNLG
jgi:hypothetical protein